MLIIPSSWGSQRAVTYKPSDPLPPTVATCPYRAHPCSLLLSSSLQLVLVRSMLHASAAAPACCATVSAGLLHHLLPRPATPPSIDPQRFPSCSRTAVRGRRPAHAPPWGDHRTHRRGRGGWLMRRRGRERPPDAPPCP
jgi:hypothetical protein